MLGNNYMKTKVCHTNLENIASVNIEDDLSLLSKLFGFTISAKLIQHFCQ